MSQQTIDIKSFATRVERLCDFLIDKRLEQTGRDGSNDLKILEDLKEDAATLQHEYVSETIEGLHDYMNGVPNEPSS